MTKLDDSDKITSLYNSVIFCIGGVGIHNCDQATKQILESATAEFLEYGFEKASMRIIAKNASVTTGSLYARYPNKNALFGALVEPVITEFLKVNDKGNEESEQKLYAGQVDEIWAGAETSATGIIELIYANKTAFSLLINCANGSSYENFIDELSAHEEKKAMEILQVLQSNGYPCLPVSEQVVHMLISAHCYALFETVRHDLSKEDALQQANQINDFFAQGWNKIYGL